MMKKILITIFLLFILNSVVYAAVTIPSKYKPVNIPDVPQTEGATVYDENTVNVYLQIFANKLISFAGPLAVLALVMSGIYMASSYGSDTSQIEEGKKRFKYVLSGLSIIFVSYVLVYTVISLILAVDNPSEPAETAQPADTTGDDSMNTQSTPYEYPTYAY
jgi:hypothetical protein